MIQVAPEQQEPTMDENTIIAQRRDKLKTIRQQQSCAFPNHFKRDTLSSHLHAEFGGMSKDALAALQDHYKLAGRIMLRRMMGQASFITIQDMSGRIQAYLRKSDLPEGVYNQFKTWDIGDIVGLEGSIFKTNTGELSIHVTAVVLLTKSLRPLPDKFHGLADQEQRYRQRYVDLMVNETSRRIFQIRSQVIETIRHFLVKHQFTEVETPMMQVIPGGAAAKPFKTFHNALDLEMYLRIAPELYLKRLVVGGFERVFEINRNFRNEGLSTRHNPEFTMLEFYQAYADYHDLMDLTEQLFHHLAEKVIGKPELMYQGELYDFTQPFTRMTVIESIIHYNPSLKKKDLHTMNTAVTVARDLGIIIDKSWGLGKVQIEIFEKTVEHNLHQPTFIIEYPAEVSPLARRNDDNPFVTDRFELFMGGREIANGFSELNDPEDQVERFQQQVAAQDAGDAEAMFYDADYVTALEYGMPPTAGEGIGIDRLVMLFTDTTSIRDVLLFPHMRPN